MEERRNELKKWITIVILLSLLAIGMFRMGPVGMMIYNVLHYLLGDHFYIVFLISILWFLISIAGAKQDADDERNPVPMILFVMDFLLLEGYAMAGNQAGFSVMDFLFQDPARFFAGNVTLSTGGGIAGNGLYALVSTLFGKEGTLIVMIAVVIIATVLLGMMDVYKNAFSYVVAFFKTPEREVVEEEEEEKEKPNLWKMIHEHQEKKANFINADESVEEQSLKEVQKKLDKGEEVVVRFKPKDTHGVSDSRIDIRADEDKEETRKLRLLQDSEDLERTLKMQKPLSASHHIFIDVNDLEDSVVQPEMEESVMPSPYVEEEEDDFILPTIDEVPAEPEMEEVEEVQQPVEKENKEEEEKKRHVVDFKKYRLPKMEKVLDPRPADNSNSENVRNAKVRGKQLIDLLAQFDIQAHLADVHIGPSVTQFEVQTEATVKVSKILGLTDNLKMSLEAKDIRIEAQALTQAMDSKAKAVDITKKIAALEKELHNKRELLASMYIDMKEGILSDSDYVIGRNILNSDIEDLKNQISALRDDDELAEVNRITSGQGYWDTLIQKYQGVTEITSGVIESFIDAIQIHADGTLDIRFRYMDEFEKITELCEKLRKEVVA